MRATWPICFITAFSLTACNEVVENLTSSTDEDESTEVVSDERDDLDAREDELREKKEKLKDRLDDLEDAVEDGDEARKEELEVVGGLDQLRSYSRKASTTHDQVKAALDGWRESTRRSFKGVKLRNITTLDGTEYSDVTITNVDADTVTFEHSGGMETVDITQLSVDLRKNLVHEPTILTEREL